jgi:hypothetical protein
MIDTPNLAADALGNTELKPQVAQLSDLVKTLVQDQRPSHYTPAQAAQEMGKSTRTISRMIERGEL